MKSGKNSPMQIITRVAEMDWNYCSENPTVLTVRYSLSLLQSPVTVGLPLGEETGDG